MSRIPFLILSVLDSSDFTETSEAIRQFLKKILLSFKRVINKWSKVGILQTAQKEENDRIPF